VKKEPRADGRRRRGYLITVLVVVVIAFGSLAATLMASWSPKLGLDLAGGLSVVYQPAHPISASEMQEEIAILTARVNASGVSGAQVQQQGNNIAVSMPGVKEAQTILDTLGATAQLLLRPVDCSAYPASPKAKVTFPTGITSNVCGAKYQISTANTSPGADPTFQAFKSTPQTADVKTSVVLLPQLNAAANAPRYTLAPAIATGRIISSATAQLNQTGQWVVNCTLTPAGTVVMNSIGQHYYGLPVAIELDGIVQSAPTINATNFDTGVEISGTFTQAQAQSLATALTYGSLPVSLVALQSQTVSPTLGHSALVAGLGAGIAGLIVVLLYAIVYYRLLGLVIVAGLGVTAALLWAIISALGHTSLAPSFTLAGVTGLIVSIGITVDSYIVYFERLKDETRSGRTVRTSLDRGFQSAWRTVLAADLVSLMAAVILYFLAIGDVRGFAFFLGLSTILDIVVTWFFTRPLVYLLGSSDRATGAARFGVARGLAVEGAGK